MARETAEETETSKGATSSRLATGTRAMLSEWVATAEAAVEQTGQMCEAEGAAVRSVQKWNCAHRKIIPRSNAEMRMRCVLACMYLVRRSLGANGCRVKRSWWRLAGGLCRSPEETSTVHYGSAGWWLGGFGVNFRTKNS